MMRVAGELAGTPDGLMAALSQFPPVAVLVVAATPKPVGVVVTVQVWLGGAGPLPE